MSNCEARGEQAPCIEFRQAPSLAPSSNRPALKKYGDSRPALVLNSPKRSTPASTAKRTNSCASASGTSGLRVVHAGVAVGFRLVSLNLNGIRSAASKGFVAWAEGGRRLYGRAGGQGAAPTWPGRFDASAALEGPLPLRAEEGLLRRRPVRAQQAERRDRRLRRREFDAEGRYVEARFDTAAAQASASSAATFPSGTSRRAPPGGQVPLPRRDLSAPAAA